MGIENDRMKILVIQIAGILARRIDNWVNLGNHLDQGEVYGMIKFGSCTEQIRFLYGTGRACRCGDPLQKRG